MSGIRVECYSGYRADERPSRFALREKTLEVLRIEDRWYDPAATYFRVIADDGQTYVLRHDQDSDAWSLAAFRAGANPASGSG